MMIQKIISPYQIYFKSSLPLKEYEKKNFVQTQKVPNEAEIIENILNLDTSITDKSNIYTSLGKIFENENLLEQARMCYEKNARLLHIENAPIKEINENEYDLTRIHDKMQKSLDITG